MKKLTSMLCAVLMAAVALTGCGDSDSSTAESKADGIDKAAADSKSAEPAEDENADPDNGSAEPDTKPEKKTYDKPVLADNSVEFAKNMGLGWNLGNTLDATGAGLESEISWGQPMTTEELIDFVRDSGFTTIRIPVSWGNHVDDDYNIDAEWMARVTEIVDWAEDAGLYIIINSHHDCDKYFPTEEHYEESERYIKAIWAQIAENFKDYDEQLIFESMNEPRLMGTNKEWWFNSDDEEGLESIRVISKLNQVFVDTVRAAGGKNETRFLMVPSNAANAYNAMSEAFTFPTDTVDSRIILSVHAYTPYDFTMNYAGGTDKWGPRSKAGLSFISDLDKTFVQNGIGVVIGEFGATNKDNLDARVAWATDYCTMTKEAGIACVLWDNGGTKAGDENFGMIDRNNFEIYYPELLNAMLECYK
ncbi:MAG: glycoside hydrolase family 5 protein [Ruminococcus sp.]|nr:glycoside hydrolase family 5 protein [Ruminococcus sp.]